MKKISAQLSKNSVTKKKTGIELKKILNVGYNVIEISRWAESIFANHCRELSPEMDDVIMTLSSMEHGPEFEYSNKELEILADLLIMEIDDPIDKLKKLFQEKGSGE